MAYGLAVASSQYLTATGATSYALSPMTMACWARPYPDARASRTASVLMCVQQAGTAHRNQMVTVLPSFACQANAVGATANVVAEVTVGTNANTWTHYASVFTSDASRTAYISGGNAVTNTASVGTQLSGNIFRIGARFAASLGLFGNADICEAGVWAAALTAAEVASLAMGASCDKVRPQSLVFYAPLVRDLLDIRGGLSLTNTNGATVVSHARVYA